VLRPDATRELAEPKGRRTRYFGPPRVAICWEPPPERPMWLVGHLPYGEDMGEDRYVVRHPSVTIEAAAALTNVEVGTIREWARRGSIQVDERGDMSVVQLEEVKKLAERQRTSRYRALRDRLKDAEGAEGSADLVNIADLQESARERNKR
jgi:hypothetical protein